MQRRPIAIVAPFLVLAFTSACSGGGASGGPLAASNMHAVTATIQPSVVPVTPVAGFGCPLLPPFTTAFGIALQQPGGAPFGAPAPFGSISSVIGTPPGDGALQVDHVTFHFLDGSNLTSQPVTFGRESPAGLSTLQFSPQFGCGIGTPVLVIADIGLIDSMGVPFTVSTRAAMR